jgi:hypothetical protein
MKNEQKKTATAAPRCADPASTKSGVRGPHLVAAACGAVGNLLSGDGWTTAVTLDDAFAPELLQTWSLPDRGKSEEEAGTDSRIIDLRNAPILT